MDLNIKKVIKKNIKFISAMITIIILGIFGISYALKVAVFNKIAVNIDTASMDVNITYDSGVNGADISNFGIYFLLMILLLLDLQLVILEFLRLNFMLLGYPLILKIVYMILLFMTLMLTASLELRI